MTAKKKTAQPRTKRRLVPQPHGGALRPGGDGVSGGRPPDAFKAMCQALASSEAVRQNVEKILKDPLRYTNLYVGALRWATEHGYGKAKESIDVTVHDLSNLSDAELAQRRAALGL